MILFLAPSSSAQNREFADRYRALIGEVEARPDDPMLRLEAAYWAGVSIQPREALQVLGTIDPATLPNASGMGPANQLYWIYLTSLWNLCGEHDRELAAAHTYAGLFPDGRWRPHLLIRPLASLGRVDEVSRVIDAEEADSNGDLARLTSLATGYFLDHGFGEAARQMIDREHAWFDDQLPIDAETDGGLEYAVSLYYAGRWIEAEERLRQLIHNDPDDYMALGYLGLVALRAGDAEEVADVDSRLAEVELPEWRLGANTVFRARIAAAQGEIERAVGLLEQALAEGYRQPAELRAAVAREFSPYLEHPRYRDFLRPGAGGLPACDGGPADEEDSVRSGGSLP
jgi:hypothetical protein